MAHEERHFTGKQSGKKIRRKPRKEHKQPGAHKNKYEHLAPKKDFEYSHNDKTIRDLPLRGDPEEIIKAGAKTLFHGRVYVLIEDVKIFPSGKGKPTYGRFKLIQQ